ncbi:hypothetical protein D3C76_518930 [compost metagenome]
MNEKDELIRLLAEQSNLIQKLLEERLKFEGNGEQRELLLRKCLEIQTGITNSIFELMGLPPTS